MVAGALFLMSASFVLAKTARDALFFAAGGIRDLPLTYVGMAVMSLPLGLATLGLMRRIGSQRTRLIALGATATALAGAGSLPPGRGLGTALAFMAIPLVFGVLFSMTWLLVAEPTKLPVAAQAAAYTRAGAGALAGGIAGGAAAKWLAASLSPQELMAIAGAVLATSALLVGFLQRARRGSRQAVARSELAHVPMLVPAPPEVRLLVAFSVLAGIVGVLVEYHFYAAVSAASSAGTPMDRFASLYLGLNLAALAALYVTPALQRATGLGGTLMTLPVVVSMLASVVWVGGGSGARAALRLAEGGLKASTHRVGWEQVFARVAPKRRSSLKLMIDGMAIRLAEGATGLGLYVAALSGPPMLALATTVLVVAATAWMMVTARLWRNHLDAAGFAVDLSARLPDS